MTDCIRQRFTTATRISNITASEISSGASTSHTLARTSANVAAEAGNDIVFDHRGATTTSLRTRPDKAEATSRDAANVGAAPTRPESSRTRLTFPFAPARTSFPPRGTSSRSSQTRRLNEELSAYETARDPARRSHTPAQAPPRFISNPWDALQVELPVHSNDAYMRFIAIFMSIFTIQGSCASRGTRPS